MLVGNRLEFIEFFFGAMRAGAIPVPLNTRLATGTLEDIFKDRIVLVLIDPTCNKDAIAIAASVPLRRKLLLDDGAKRAFLNYERELACPRPPCAAAYRRARAGLPALHLRLDRPAEGRNHDAPRHALVCRVQSAPLARVAESDRGMVALPLFHKNALRGTVKPMLYAGGSFVLMPGYEPRAYLEALAKYAAPIRAASRRFSRWCCSIASTSRALISVR